MNRSYPALQFLFFVVLGVTGVILFFFIKDFSYATDFENSETFIGPTVGAVTDRSATFWIQTDKSVPVFFRYGTVPNTASFTKTVTIDTTDEHNNIAQFPVQNLRSDVLYYYTPNINGKDIFTGNFPKFITAPEQEKEQEFTVAILSDFGSPISNEVQSNSYYSAFLENPSFTIVGGDLDHRNSGNSRKNNIQRLQKRIRTIYE